jgi:hypothetical protein
MCCCRANCGVFCFATFNVVVSNTCVSYAVYLKDDAFSLLLLLLPRSGVPEPAGHLVRAVLGAWSVHTAAGVAKAAAIAYFLHLGQHLLAMKQCKTPACFIYQMD